MTERWLSSARFHCSMKTGKCNSYNAKFLKPLAAHKKVDRSISYICPYWTHPGHFASSSIFAASLFGLRLYFRFCNRHSPFSGMCLFLPMHHQQKMHENRRTHENVVNLKILYASKGSFSLKRCGGVQYHEENCSPSGTAPENWANKQNAYLNREQIFYLSGKRVASWNSASQKSADVRCENFPFRRIFEMEVVLRKSWKFRLQKLHVMSCIICANFETKVRISKMHGPVTHFLKCNHRRQYNALASNEGFH